MRYVAVTGVQACALPISPALRASDDPADRSAARGTGDVAAHAPRPARLPARGPSDGIAAGAPRASRPPGSGDGRAPERGRRAGGDGPGAVEPRPPARGAPPRPRPAVSCG